MFQVPYTVPAALSEMAGSVMWIYVLGSLDGQTIKLGHTNEKSVCDRLRQVEREQMSDEKYVLLAAVRSAKTGEDAAHRFFEEWRQPRGSHKEYYDAAEPLIEWVLWLRQQWFASFKDTDTHKDAYDAHPDEWIPKPGRSESRPPVDPTKLIPENEQLTGPLAGTIWAWMPDLTFSFQDYFTPPEIVRVAWEAMGGIDLDAASHWLANRRLHEHGLAIGEFFHTNKSAFTHDWLEKVWLNPPYGENDRWFRRALDMLDAGLTTQLCMLSPVYAFSTGIAKPMMRRAAAALLLSPTPEFYNPGDPTRTGTNLPHAVVYWGDRHSEFIRSFAKFGVPFSLAWEHCLEAA
jgi:hypothetical protein